MPNQFTQLTSETDKCIKADCILLGRILEFLEWNTVASTSRVSCANTSPTPMAEKTAGLAKRMADDDLGPEHKRKKTSPRVDAASVSGVAPDLRGFCRQA